MARMIPPAVSEACVSHGEVEIFHRIKGDPKTEDWIVLHSLDIAHHREQVSGELDFVVMIPRGGVLCLEVKACTSVSCKDGQWYYGTNPHPDLRGPFKQVAAAMHSLRSNLISRRPEFSEIMFWSVVIFPFLQFNIHSEEWCEWQVIDMFSLRQGSLGFLLLVVTQKAREHLASCKKTGWFNPSSSHPTREECEIIAQLMRPSFEFFESPKSRTSHMTEEIKHFTEEQFSALDAIKMNPRVVFVGPAGTGKTLLAIEAARRSAAAGNKVLFVCFNKLLGAWLSEEMDKLKDNIVVGSLHRYMLFVSGETPVGPEQEFWKTVLPHKAIDRLLQDEKNCSFDELIADEAQDLLRREYLDFLDVNLKGGLSAGRWRMFGDFEKQAIYNAADMPLEDFVATRGSQAPIFSLRVNCRNTPRIAAMASLLGGLTPGYAKILRPDDHVCPKIQYYLTREKQENLLVSVLENLYNEGFTGDDIVILSPLKEGSCVSSISDAVWGQRLRLIGTSGSGYIQYSTIHAFKGMEAPVIIVTDISAVNNPESEALFYVAVTRTLSRLVILMHESVKKEVAKILLK